MIVLVAALAACSSAVPMIASPATPVPASEATVVNASGITADRRGQLLNLKVGDTFAVRIPTIPQSGFTWQPQDLDTHILLQLGDPVYEPDSGSNAAGGTVILRFKVVGAGRTALTLIYAGSPSGGGPSLYRDSFGITLDAH